MSESERPDFKFHRMASLYGAEGARAIVDAIERLIALFSGDHILDIKEVARRLSCSRKTVLRMNASGELPTPVRIIGNRIGWRRSDFERWLAARPRIHPN